jgi:hypothetical protein
VDLVLRRLQADLDQQLGGVGGQFAQRRDLGPLRGVERLQHERSRVLASGRTPDPDPDSLKVLGAQGIGDRTQPVVAALSAADLEPYPAEVDVEFVVDDDHVGPLAKFYSVAPGEVIVIHDELDIDFGRIRLKLGGGEGGHNGLRSIANSLSTKDFQRVRVGIGRPPGRKDPAAFVLEPFTAAERPEVPTLCELAADATELLAQVGLEPAQNQVHAW